MIFATDPIHTIENLIHKYKTRSFSIYIIVVLGLTAFIGSLPFVYIDISSQSRGIIRSIHDNVPISSIVSGRVIQLNIKNNKAINVGDTLLSIAIDNIEVENQINSDLVATHRQNYTDLGIILSGLGSLPSSPLYREEYLKFLAQKSELESREALAKIRYNRSKLMYDEKVIAKAEYETILFDLEYAQKALQSLIKQQYAQWESQRNEILVQIKNLEGLIQKLEVQKENYVILSPISGTVANFLGIQVGSYMNAGQTIAEISPDHDLIVETAVSPNDIGLIKKDQRIKYQIDAFNYNQWGLLTGEVVDIDRNVTIDNNISYFKVRCSLDSLDMSLKTGYTTKVTKGMTLTSRFMITRRSLYELLFDKVDDWLNPTQITK